MLNVAWTEWPTCFFCLYLLYYCMEMYVNMCTSCTDKDVYIYYITCIIYNGFTVCNNKRSIWCAIYDILKYYYNV